MCVYLAGRDVFDRSRVPPFWTFDTCLVFHFRLVLFEFEARLIHFCLFYRELAALIRFSSFRGLEIEARCSRPGAFDFLGVV